MSSSVLSAPEGSIARTIIKRAMRRGRLAHSILLFGKDQESLESLALEVSALLLEFSPRVESETVAAFPDFFALRPSKKARQISADDTRNLIRRIQHSPQVGARKVAVVFEADRMNVASSNIFLKTLEEPPLDTTILLLTTRPYSLLATIRSRCLHLRVTEDSGREEDSGTRDWLVAYRSWLDQLVDGPPTREKIPELIIGLYGLVSGFKDNLEKITKTTLAAHANPDGNPVSDEEKIALEAGLAVSIRDGMLARIEETTCTFARDQAGQGRAYIPARLPAAIESIEEMTGLLRVNLKAEVALEQFLLTSLRLWAAPE